MAAEDGKRVEGSIPQSAAPGRRVLLLRRPLGVLGLITPGTGPTRCPPRCSRRRWRAATPSSGPRRRRRRSARALLAECVAEADLPPGVFNFVLGPGPEVGDELAANPGTRAVAFTGSTETGLIVSRQAAGKAQLLEMGGNGPLVVLEDADLAAAAEAARVGSLPRRGPELLRGRAHPRARGGARRVRLPARGRGRARGAARRSARRRDDHGAGQQRARRGQDGRARGRRRRARRDGRDRRQPRRGLPHRPLLAADRARTTCRPTRSRSRRRPSDRSRRSSASARSRTPSSRRTRRPTG